MRLFAALLASYLWLGYNGVSIAQSDQTSSSSAPTQSVEEAPKPADQPKQEDKTPEPSATQDNKDESDQIHKPLNKKQRSHKQKKSSSRKTS